MHNPPNFRRPNPPSLPSEPAKPPRPSPPTLPYEIFINILGQLRDDKPSLAKCMRVSNSFNTITAPIRYSSVIVDAGKKNPYDTTRGIPVAARLSSDAAANVGMINNVIVLSHPPTKVVAGLMASITKLESIRVEATVLDQSKPCFKCLRGLPHFFTRGNACIFVRMIRPKKLIVSSTRVNTCLHDVSGYRTLDTVVFIIGHNTLFKTDTQPKDPYHRRLPELRRSFKFSGPIIHFNLAAP